MIVRYVVDFRRLTVVEAMIVLYVDADYTISLTLSLSLSLYRPSFVKVERLI